MSRTKQPRTWQSTLQATVPEGRDLELSVRGVFIVESPDADACERQVAIYKRFCFGRSPDPRVDLAIADPRMSSVHAFIERKDGSRYEVQDVDSRNGTWVSGERVSTTFLLEGDVIRLGRTFMVFGQLAPDRPDDEVLVGRSPAFCQVLSHLERVAPAKLPVLLLGETGTGKEVVARRIHERSGRSGPFVAVNCGAIPKELVESHLFGHKRGAFTGATASSPGVFREAHGGTLFLDEIGELPLAQQPKLLRVLETHEVTPVGSTQPVKTDVRVVSATNANLPGRATAGTFRRDLFARLAGLVIELPPLRRRRSDILRLMRHFLDQLAPDLTFRWQTRALEYLLVYDWPLNVRELRNLVERMSLMGDELETLTANDLESLLGVSLETGRAHPQEEVAVQPVDYEPTRPGTPRSRSRRPPRSELVVLMTKFEGNITRVAEHYGKNPRQIYRWLKFFDLDPNTFR